MTDINNLTIIGRLTKDVEVSYTPGGMDYTNFSIAVNRSVKKNEQWTDEVSYFDVKLFGNTAKNLGPYLTKGKQIAIDGYLHQDRWEKDGQKNSRVVICANNVQLCGGKDQNSNSNNGSAGYDPDGYSYN